MKNTLFLIVLSVSFLLPGMAKGELSDASSVPVNAVSLTPTQEGVMVSLTLERKEDVSVSVLQGDKLVWPLHRGAMNPGSHEFIWKDRKPTRSGSFVLTVRLNGVSFHQEGFMKEAAGNPPQEDRQMVISVTVAPTDPGVGPK